MFEELAEGFGVDWKVIVKGVPFIIFLVSALKDLMEIKGKKQILPIVAVSSLTIGFLAGFPDLLGIFAYWVILFAMSIGSWSGLKKLAHKRAVPPKE